MKTIKIQETREYNVDAYNAHVKITSQEQYDEVVRLLAAAGQELSSTYYKEFSLTENNLLHVNVNGVWFWAHQHFDTHEVTIEQLAEMLEVEYPLPATFEKGKWYVNVLGDVFLFDGGFDYDGDPKGAGFDVPANAFIPLDDDGWRCNGVKEANMEVVHSLLLNWARKTYPIGSEVRCLDCGVCLIQGHSFLVDNGAVYASQASDGSCYDILFKDGEWAKVVEHEITPETYEDENDEAIGLLVNLAINNLTSRKEGPYIKDWFGSPAYVTTHSAGDGYWYHTKKEAVMGAVKNWVRNYIEATGIVFL